MKSVLITPEGIQKNLKNIKPLGLYITTFENQAKKWTVRKGMRRERLQ